MAITTKEEGVWSIDQVYAKQNQGSIWVFDEPAYFWTWGSNPQGTLGMNNRTQYSSPNQIGTASNWVSLVGSEQVAGGVKDDGTLWLWGYNSHGQLGDSTNTTRSSPVQVPGTTWDGSNFRMGCAKQISLLKTDGTLWSWGYACYGRAGTPETGCVNISSPRQIPGTTWASNFTHNRGGGAIKTDGTLWMWGIGTEGNLANNLSGPHTNGSYRSSPVQIPGTTWKQGCGNASGIAAIKTDGTLWIWGRGADGTGVNNTISYSSPVQIPGTNWSTISNNKKQKLATKTDGTLWIWGSNINGELGQNNRTQYSSPVQIPGTDWDINLRVGGYSTHSFGIKTDGTLWAWGRGNAGQLGQNNVVFRSSPVQIPGNNYVSAMSHSYNSSAIGKFT